MIKFLADCALLLLILLALAGGPVFAETKKSLGVWRFDYIESGINGGSSTVFLSDRAIKIQTSGYEVISSAPNWIALVKNKNSKRFCELPPAQWRLGFFLDRSGSAEEMNPRTANSVSETTYRGMKARKFVWKSVEPDELYRVRSHPTSMTDELIVSSDIPCLSSQLGIVSSWFSIPYLSGMPLLHQNRCQNEIKPKLRLKNVLIIPDNSVSFAASTAGFKRASKMHDLIDASVTNTINDFMEFQKGFDRE